MTRFHVIIYIQWHLTSSVLKLSKIALSFSVISIKCSDTFNLFQTALDQTFPRHHLIPRIMNKVSLRKAYIERCTNRELVWSTCISWGHKTRFFFLNLWKFNIMARSNTIPSRYQERTMVLLLCTTKPFAHTPSSSLFHADLVLCGLHFKRIYEYTYFCFKFSTTKIPTAIWTLPKMCFTKKI